MTALIAVMLGANAAIAFVFCWGVWGRAGGVSFAWPPSFLRVVVAWIGSKGVWLTALTYLWARQRVGYAEDATTIDHVLYPAALGLFTLWHAYAAYCWIAGQATIDDAPRSQADDR